MIEALEGRRLLSVTNPIEGVGVIEAGGRIPADPHGAAGPNHVVNVVNSHIQWFTKAGANQGNQSLMDFFTPLGTNSTSRVFDPKVVYDQYNDRFVVVALWLEEIVPGDPTQGFVNESHTLLAVSDDADPNGTWYFQDIDTKVNINGQDTWLDYPGLAVSNDAIYVTGNMFPFDFATTVASEEPSFGVAGTRLFIIPKGPLYGGGESFVRPGGYDPVRDLGLVAGDFVPAVPLLLTLQPAHMYGAAPTGLGTFLTLDAGQDPQTGLDSLYVIRVDNPLGNPVFSATKLALGDINTRRYPGVPQPVSQGAANQFLGLNPRLDGGDARILSAVWRDGMLYATQVVVPPDGQADQGQVTAHWYQVATGTASQVTALSLFDQGNIGGEELGVGTHTFYPAVSVNPRGDMAIGFSAASPEPVGNNQPTTPTGGLVFPGAYVTTQLFSDRALGRRGFTRPAEALAVGAGYYVTGEIFSGAQMRWGDYSGISVDIDILGNETNAFWAYNKYAGPPTTTLFGTPVTDEWSTRWGRFVPELLDLPAVGNFVWNDMNGNGIQDPGEPGLAGVVFRLVDGLGNVVHQTVSDANGVWYLQGPPTGGATAGTTYRVVADISAIGANGRPLFDGFTYSPVDRDPLNVADSDFTMVPSSPFQAQTIPILFEAGMFNETIDLGLFKPFVSITALTPTVVEGGPGSVKQARFRLTLSSGVTDPVTGLPQEVTSPWATRVYYSTIGTQPLDPRLQVIPPPGVSATPQEDFFTRSVELVTIPAGQSRLDADLVPVLGDATPEGNERFAVYLLEPSDVYGYINENLPPGIPPDDLLLDDTSQIRSEAERAALVTIQDDDMPVLTVDAGPTVVEPGAGQVAYALFTIRLSSPNPLSTPVSVRYTLTNGTATGGADASSGADYGNVGGVVEFAPGQLTKTVRVPVFGDFNGSEGNETFTLSVEAVNTGNLNNGTVAQRVTTATIVNLQTQKLTFNAKKSLTFRDQAGILVTVSLTGPGSGSVVTTAGGEGRGLVLNGTTERSVLTIRTNRGQANFGGITVNGGLARLAAPTTNVNGSITSSGAIRDLAVNFVTGGQIVLGPSTGGSNVLISLNVNRIANSSLTSETAIRQLTIGSWIDTGDEDFLVAPAIRTIQATGDFGASVQPSSGDLGTMSVGGVLKGSDILVSRAGGNGGELGTIGTITVGSMLNTTVTAARRIDRVTVRSLFSDSTIDAPSIGTLELGTVRNSTKSVLTAVRADRITSARWAFKGRAQVISNVNDPGTRGLDKAANRNPRIILEII